MDYQEWSKYSDLVELLTEIKDIWGPMALNGTLQKRPKIKKFLKEYQNKILDDLETKL